MMINGTSCVGWETQKNMPEKDAKIRAFCQGWRMRNEDEVKRVEQQ